MAIELSGSTADRKDGQPFAWPKMSVGTWVKSVLLRVGVPVVLAAVLWSAAVSSSAGDLRTATEGLAVSIACFGAWWLLHWVYAMWRKQNADNERSAPIVTACRAVLAVLFLYLVSLLGMVLGGAGLGTAPGSFGALLGSLLGDAFGQLLASGLILAVALLAVVRIASRFFQQWTARREPTEQLWWIDAVGRAVFVLLYVVAAVGLLIAFCKFGPLLLIMEQSGLFGSDVVSYVTLSGSWMAELGAALGQLAGSGVLAVVVAALAIRIAFKRFRLWCDLKFEQEKRRIEEEKKRAERIKMLPLAAKIMGHGNPSSDSENASADAKPDGSVEIPRTRFYLMKRALPLMSGIGWALLVLVLAGSALTLADQYAGAPFLLLRLFVSALLSPSPALPLAFAAFVAAQALFGVVEHWNDATGGRHGFLNGLARFFLYLVMGACALLVLYAIVDAERSFGIFGLIVDRMQMSTYVPTVWTFLFQVAMRAAYLVFVVVVVLVVICVVIAALAGGGGGGGGGGAPAGGGGGGGGAAVGSSFGGGSSSKKQTVTDRYGRKLLSVEDEGISGTSVRDRHGNKIGEVHTGIDGTQHVRIGDDKYEVTDGFFGGKNVTKDGRKVGGIDDEGRFRKQ